MRHELSIEVDAGDVAWFASCEMRVVVAKPAGGAAPNTAWLAIRLARSCLVTWQETVGVYAATVPHRAGACLDVTASVYPAAERALYRFTGRALECLGVSSGIPRLHVDVANGSKEAVTLGLLQQAAVDGVPVLSALNAAIVPAGHSADFTPSSTVLVWAQSGLAASSIIEYVPQDAVRLSYRDGDACRVRWERARAAFRPVAAGDGRFKSRRAGWEGT